MRKWIAVVIAAVIVVVTIGIVVSVRSDGKTTRILSPNGSQLTMLPVDQYYYCNAVHNGGGLQAMVSQLGYRPDPNSPNALVFKTVVETSPTIVRANLVIIYHDVLKGESNPTLLVALQHTTEVIC